jgi:preprotein translocase subunit SecD
MRKLQQRLLFILLLTGLAVFLNLPFQKPELNFRFGTTHIVRDFNLKQGLDIKGGTHLVLEAKMDNVSESDKSGALLSLQEVISKRVDLYGVSEPIIQTALVGDSYRLIVELPGIEDINSALDLIGQTAQLDFRENIASDSATELIFASTGLTGNDLKRSVVTYDSQNLNNQPAVNLEFTSEGAKKFAAVTQRNLSKPVAIFLDDQLITAPIVNQTIDDGRAIITGNFTADHASQLAIQLNAGALPVPIEVIQQQNISATLGSDSVQKSLFAGLVGLGLVMLFMVLTYGLNGLIADLALLIYGLLSLSIYRLIPVTLTLTGLAGFILSVGMAVDANILIFERLKEELRLNKSFKVALELAFGRAWESIKDANVVTIITCLVLLNPFNLTFLNTSGLVRGFALTLLIGVLTSLFTGVLVTRTLMRLIFANKL